MAFTSKQITSVMRNIRSLRTTPVSDTVRITKSLPINIGGGKELRYLEGFCEHSDIENSKLPVEDVAGGSNFIETDTGDWYFFIESTKTYEVRTSIERE